MLSILIFINIITEIGAVTFDQFHISKCCKMPKSNTKTSEDGSV